MNQKLRIRIIFKLDFLTDVVNLSECDDQPHVKTLSAVKYHKLSEFCVLSSIL